MDVHTLEHKKKKRKTIIPVAHTLMFGPIVGNTHKKYVFYVHTKLEKTHNIFK